MCSIFKPEFYIDSFCVNMRICFNMKGVDHVSNNNYFSVARRHYVKPPACSHFQFYSSYFPCGLSLPFITKISVARVLTWTYKDFLCNYFKLTIHKYVLYKICKHLEHIELSRRCICDILFFILILEHLNDISRQLFSQYVIACVLSLSYPSVFDHYR